MRTSPSNAKGTKAKAKKAAVRDLKPTKADAAKGGATNTTRFDPYKSFKFRP
jgi:hypothetical protein